MRVNMRDLLSRLSVRGGSTQPHIEGCGADAGIVAWGQGLVVDLRTEVAGVNIWGHGTRVAFGLQIAPHEIVETDALRRSEEHTSELQSLMRISYAVFCLKKKKKDKTT